MNPKSIDILNICSVGYRCIIVEISKSEALNLLQNVDLRGKKWILKKYNFSGIVKRKFYHCKNPIFSKDVDSDKILISDKTSSAE